MYPNLADAIGRQPNEQLIMTRTTLPPHDEIKPDTPLPLGMAAALVFPDGSMTAFGLRREGARGRLLSSAGLRFSIRTLEATPGATGARRLSS